MAVNEYVDYTLASGNNDGTTWADAWRTDPSALASALASCNAGGAIWVKCDSVATFAADTTLSSANGTAANPVSIISVEETTTNEPPSSGDYKTMVDGGGSLDAKTSGSFDLIVSGWDIWDGLYFIAGDEFRLASVNNINTILENCKVNFADLFSTGQSFSNSLTVGLLFNCDLEISANGGISLNASFFWSGGSFSFDGGTVATNLITYSRAGNITIQDVDIQDLDSGDYLVDDTHYISTILFKRCKIPAAVNYMDAGPSNEAQTAKFHSVDDGDNIFTFKEYYFTGLIESDTAVYLDATYDGVNEYSAKMTSNANAREWQRPLRFKLADIYATANPTLTVELNTDNITLQNDEFWVEVEYPDGTTGALGVIDQSSRPANVLTTPANLTGSAAAWTEGFGTEVPQKVEVTIAGGQAGIHTVWACLAKPSTIVYVNPFIAVS